MRKNKTKSSKDYWVDTTILPIKDQNNKIVYYYSIRIDVTQKMNLIYELENNQKLLNEAEEIAKVARWDYDASRHTLKWSRSINKILSLEDISDISTPENFKRFVPNEDIYLNELEYVSSIKNKRKYFYIDHRFKNKNGEVKWLTHICNKVFTAENEYLGSYGVLKDVSEERKISEKYVETLKIAEETSSYRAQFINSMSHEIRTPLHAILGYSDLLEKEIDYEKIHFYSKSIKSIAK